MDETKPDAEGTPASSADEMSFEEKRHDQLTSAPDAEESDAAPRIDITQTPEGNTRIDWRDDAPVRPGTDEDEAATEAK